MGRIFHTKVYIIPGVDHHFGTLRDAQYECKKLNIDPSIIEVYDSVSEHERWLELKELQKKGAISNLERQVEFELTPKVYKPKYVRHKDIKTYIVTIENCDVSYRTKKEAVTMAKKYGVPIKSIRTSTESIPVFKQEKVLDSAVYTADFTYIEDGNFIVEDVKSKYTAKEKDYVLRKKFLYHTRNILIREIIVEPPKKRKSSK